MLIGLSVHLGEISLSVWVYIFPGVVFERAILLSCKIKRITNTPISPAHKRLVTSVCPCVVWTVCGLISRLMATGAMRFGAIFFGNLSWIAYSIPTSKSFPSVPMPCCSGRLLYTRRSLWHLSVYPITGAIITIVAACLRHSCSNPGLEVQFSTMLEVLERFESLIYAINIFSRESF
jgi:hypothetical protein